jgi:hypothetical protein
MSNEKLGRREVLKRALVVLAAAPVGAASLSACGSSGGGGGGGLHCTDTAGLQPAEVTMRNTQAYSDTSPHADQHCRQCRFFQPAAGGATACGSCQVVRGPIHPDGYCNLFSAAS